MSEQFEAGLRDLYAAAEMAHDTRPGLAVDLMVARTRRHRRARAAAVTLATAAAVVGFAAAGVAMLGRPGTTPVPPAAPESPVNTTLACGTAVADLGGSDPEAAVHVNGTLATPTVTTVDPLLLELTATSDGDVVGSQLLDQVEYAIVADGVVVGEARDVGDVTLDGLGTEWSWQAPLTWDPCPGAGVDGVLGIGSYELWAAFPYTGRVIDSTLRLVVAGPWPFEVTAAQPRPETPASPEVTTQPLRDPEDHIPAEGFSAAPPVDPTAPLPDGDYLAHVSDIDADAGAVTADLVVLYFGSAAEEWAAANAPGTEIMDDYVSDDPDGPAERVIPIGDVPVWDLCPGPERIELVQRTGGLAEWAVAPWEGGESLCSDTSTIPVSGLYWLDVRGGVIAQVVAQYVP